MQRFDRGLKVLRRQLDVETVMGANLLEQDKSLKDNVAVDYSGFDITIPDRLRFPNTADTFAAIGDELTDAIVLATGAESVSLQRVENDAREPLVIRAALS